MIQAVLFFLSVLIAGTSFSHALLPNLEQTAENKPQLKKKRYEVVGSKADRPGFSKIQEAIEMARSEGASSQNPAVIAIDAGKYEEDLTLYDGIEIEGPDGEILVFDKSPSVQILGSYSLPQDGAVTLKNLTFQVAPPELGSSSAPDPKSLIVPPTERTNPANTNSGSSGPAVTPNAVLIGSPSGTISSLPVGGNGQILIGSAGAPPAWGLPTDTATVVWSNPGPGILEAEVVGGTGGISAVVGVAPINVTTSVGGTATVSLTGIVSPTNGGTGHNNGSNTITLGGNLSTAGSFTTLGGSSSFTFPGGSSTYTFPASGTLLTTASGAPLTEISDTNVTLTLGGSPTTALVNAASITAGWAGTLAPLRGGTGKANSNSDTITLGGPISTVGAFTTAVSGSLTLSTQAGATATLPTFPFVSGVPYNLAVNGNFQAGAFQTTVYVNPQTGSNTDGDGSATNPYQTIGMANSIILDNSTTKRYTILLQGIATETTVQIKPFVSIFGYAYPTSQIIASGGVTLNTAAWAGVANGTFELRNINFNNGTNVSFNFHNVTGGSAASVLLTDTLMNGGGTLTLQGRASATTSDSVTFLHHQSGVSTVTDLNVFSYLSVYAGSTTYQSTNSLLPTSWTSIADRILASVTISETSAQTATMNVSCSNVQNSVALTSSLALYNYDVASYPRTGFSLPLTGVATPKGFGPQVGINTTITPAESPYTALPSDYIIFCNSITGTITVNLPSAPVTGQTYSITDFAGSAGTFNITVSGNGNTINGLTSYTIGANYGSVQVVFDSASPSGWVIESSSMANTSSNAQTYVYVNPQTGSDTTGNGSAINPFATIATANSAITGNNSSTKPYTLLLQGSITEANPLLLPYVSWMGLSLSTQMNGSSIALDPSWAGTTDAFASIQNLTLANGTGIGLDLHGVSGTTSNIKISDIYINASSSPGGISLTGRANGLDIYNLVNVSVFGDTIITDASGSSETCLFLGDAGVSFSLISTNATTAISWTSNCDMMINPIVVSETTNLAASLIISNAALQNTVTLTGVGAFYSYDPVSYPGAGFVLSGGTANPLSPVGLNLVPVTDVSQASYPTLLTDFVINVNFNGAVAISLNGNSVNGQYYRIKDASGAAATHPITITDANGNNIDGSTSYIINTNYGHVDLIFDDINSPNWYTY